MKKTNILVIVFLILLILILKWPILNMPYHWDSIYITEGASWIHNNNFNPILPGMGFAGGINYGHPPFSYLFLAFMYSLFGESPLTSHLTILFFAFLSLYFTFLLGSILFNKKVGIIASLFLFFTPLFFAQIGLVNLDIMLTAFTLMTFYFVLKKNNLGFFIFGSLLVLTKEPGIFIVASIFLYKLYEQYKHNNLVFKELVIYAFPALIFLSWYFIQWLKISVFFYPPNIYQDLSIRVFFRFGNRLRYLFLDDFKWILTTIFFVSIISIRKVRLNFKNILLSLIPSFLIFIFFWNITIIIQFLDKFLHIDKGYFLIEAAKFQPYAFLFTFIIFICFITKFNFKQIKFDKTLPFIIVTILFLILFSFTSFNYRYLLPLYPFFFIITANSLNKIFKKYTILIILIILLLFIIPWGGDSTDSRGYILEKNIEYLDMIKTHAEMDKFIEENYPDATILTSWPMIEELRYPSKGYTTKEINIINALYYDSNYKLQKIDQEIGKTEWYFYSCYKQKQCDNTNLTIEEKIDIRIYDTRYQEELTSEMFDLLYYSPQSFKIPNYQEIITDFDLILIKRFESNGKYTELYGKK